VLKFQLRLVACFFVSCALLAYGLNALLLLEHATSGQAALSQSLSHDEEASFEWITREQPDDTYGDAEAVLGDDFLAAPRLIPLLAPALGCLATLDFSYSPSVLLSRPPPWIC
jgi:hypothetical protein